MVGRSAMEVTQAGEGGGRVVRVLFADPDPALQGALQAIFAEEDYAARVAWSGEDLLACLLAEQPVGLTLDLLLPPIDRATLCRHLGQDGAPIAPSVTVSAIPADAGQLERTFMALLASAREALDGQGNLVVRVQAGSRWVQAQLTSAGAGLSEACLLKIFDPLLMASAGGGPASLAGNAVRHRDPWRHRPPTPVAAPGFAMLPPACSRGQGSERCDGG